MVEQKGDGPMPEIGDKVERDQVLASSEELAKLNGKKSQIKTLVTHTDRFKRDDVKKIDNNGWGK